MAAMRIRPGRVSGCKVRDTICCCYACRIGSFLTVVVCSKHHNYLTFTIERNYHQKLYLEANLDTSSYLTAFSQAKDFMAKLYDYL